MAEKFKKSAIKVKLMSGALNKWKQPSDTPKSQKSRRESVTDTFRNAVSRVKANVRVSSIFGLLGHEVKAKRAHFQPLFTTEKSQSQSDENQGKDDEEKVSIRLKDLPPMRDEDIVEFTSKELTGRLLKSKYFKSTIVAVIITNSLLIAIETDENLERSYSHVFTVLDQMMMTIFVCEILIKWYHGFLKFWKQGWNILDFFIVVALLFGPLLTSGTSGSRGVIRILRVLRAFRSLRGISSQPGLQVIVQTILQSVPDMANIVLLLVIIMLVFSVIGITLFRDVVPDYFGTLSTAMFSLFTCLTQDGWMEIFEAFQKNGDNYYSGGGLFLLVFIAIGAFIFTNLVVAVVVTNLECAVVDVKTEEEQLAREMELQGLLENVENATEGQEYNILEGGEIQANVFRKQCSLFIPDLEKCNDDSIEKYFVIVTAIEDNLAEYHDLLSELNELFSLVCELNENVQVEAMLGGETMGSDRRTSTATVRKLAMTGDLVSDLIDMERQNLISSRGQSLAGVLEQGAEAVVRRGTNRLSVADSLLTP